MGVFDIDYDSLVVQLLPVRLRKNKMVSWLRSLVSQAKWLYGQFKTYRSNNLYNLAHNGQVCYLQAALNDVFDPVLRGIYLADGPFKDPLFVYLLPENKPLWLGLNIEAGMTSFATPQVLYCESETSVSGVGFIVNVPVTVASGADYDVLRLRALVDAYRLPGRKNYTIVTY